MGSKGTFRWSGRERVAWDALSIRQVRGDGAGIFSRGSPISPDLEISTGLGGESWDEKRLGILGAWSPRLLDSSVGKSRDQATNKQSTVLMDAPIYALFLFPLSGTCFCFPYLPHLSKNFGCFTLLFYVPPPQQLPRKPFLLNLTPHIYFNLSFYNLALYNFST